MASFAPVGELQEPHNRMDINESELNQQKSLSKQSKYSIPVGGISAKQY
jgi:hypothetical protein